jgi:hypothetical protein
MFGNIICHAGGKIWNSCYTNSLEAINKNYNEIIEKSSCVLIEIDCCKISDGYIIAHDNCEKNLYKYDKKFDDIKMDEYKLLKIHGVFTPMTFEILNDFLNKNNNVYFIIDSKEDLNDFFIDYVKNIMHKNDEKLIFQVYNENDIKLIEKYKFKILYALWKYNYDAYNEKIEKNINYIIQKNICCVGISLYNFRYIKNSKEISDLKSHNIKIYIHGEEDLEKNKIFLEEGFGIFTHEPNLYL